MINRFLLIFLMFLSQSCSFDGYDKKRDFRLGKDFQLDDGSAIIITKVDINYTAEALLATRTDTDFTEMNWCRDENEKKCAKILPFSPYTRAKLNKGRKTRHSFYKLDSGNYYLNQVKEYRSYTADWYLLPIKIPLDIVTGGLIDIATGGAAGFSPNFSTRVSGWNKELNTPNFAYFETKPKEIVYIGDLNFSVTGKKKWVGAKINLEIKDNYKEALTSFRMEHPEFANTPVVKRLAHPGSLLDNFDAGIFW